jgi:3-oxoadipate CoA-transferase alpha subunit
MDKVVASVDEAVAVVKDGDCVMIGGFGGAGFPFALRDALAKRRLKGLTIICNNSDFGELAADGGITRIICSFPAGATAAPVVEGIERGDIELLLTPQGTLAEQIRAGGAGLGGILTPTGLDADLGRDWPVVDGPDGKPYFLVPPLRADVAFVHAAVGDSFGNLSHRLAARNFNPLMAMAATVTVAEVERVVTPGGIDPNSVHVPAAFVDIVVPLGGAA